MFVVSNTAIWRRDGSGNMNNSVSAKSFTRERISASIVEVCRHLHGRNMLAAADGNISVRLENGNILITPSGIAKAFMNPEEMAEINLDGETICGEPSSEKLMHLMVYRNVPKARAVIHAHPPTAIAWSIAHPELAELPAEGLAEIILAVGRLPIIPYARPGRNELGEALLPELIKGQRVMILARHGALSWGEDLAEAYAGMERLEHAAQILKFASDLGGITSLPAEELAALRLMRKTLGERTL